MSVLGRSGIDEEASSRCWEETDLLHSPLIVLDHPPRVLKFLISTLLLRRYRAAFSLQKSTVLLADRKRPVRVVKPSPLCEHFLSTEFIVHFYSYTRYNPLRTERMDRGLPEAIRETEWQKNGRCTMFNAISLIDEHNQLLGSSVLAYLSTNLARKSKMENGRICIKARLNMQTAVPQPPCRSILPREPPNLRPFRLIFPPTTGYSSSDPR